MNVGSGRHELLKRRRPELVQSVREPGTRQTTITLGQTFEFDLESSAVKRVPRPAVQASLEASVGSATYDPQLAL